MAQLHCKTVSLASLLIIALKLHLNFACSKAHPYQLAITSSMLTNILPGNDLMVGHIPLQHVYVDSIRANRPNGLTASASAPPCASKATKTSWRAARPSATPSKR